MAKAFAQGTQLRMEDAGVPGTYLTIAHVKDFPFPSSERDMIDVTDHDSPNGRKEYIGGLIDSGEIAFSVNYNPAHTTHGTGPNGLLGKVNSGAITNFRIVMVAAAGSVTWSFAAIVRKFQPKAPVNGIYEADVTLKVTGDITVA